ncbi:hypothetical protein C2857_004509 [Epichloe festucae Fl1]|uniref:Pre-mRNA splicing factor CLF1 n=1 Tax=Epichloe festucae (strain Fl1) TaxID=877507 RepID=A0A7S9KSD8_EPIFF|nr:hypothetical protein C2857_004509 [Epichloe festucae Fl1]
MPVPKPPSSLDNSCTVIYNNTLYSYSPEGFVSIALENGAVWKKLDMGVKVNGATCVGSAKPKNIDPAFFVVGGQTGSDDYTGLQKYTYSTGKWTTVKPTNLVTKHRQWHTSAYIEASDTILVFGGNQDGRGGSSVETFSISASEPYTVITPPPRPAPDAPPPSVRPIVASWTDSDLIMVGGGTGADNAKVFYFNSQAGWRYSGASLAEPPAKDTNSIQGICVSGADGSTSLMMFDLSQSPNKVSRVVLRDAGGSPKLKSPIISRQATVDVIDLGKRDLALSNWPEYNATLAPKVTRQNAAMAQAPNGMVVFSSGNAEDPIALFNTTNNGWINATTFFTGSEQKILSSTSTTSSTSASTTLFTSTTASSVSTAATTSTTAAAVPPASSKTEDSGPSSNAILGITLGSIAGFLVLLGIILLLLRRRKKSLEHSEAGEPKPKPMPDEKDMSDFARSTFSPTGAFHGHRPQASAESYSSVAILMGRINKEKSGLSRKPSNDSTHSSISSLHKQFKSTISKPMPQTTQHPSLQGQDERGVAFAPSVAEPRPRNGPMEANDGTRRSSGWNRYWSGGSALQILGFGNGKRATATSERSSQYSEAMSDPRATQSSATVPPLNFDGRPRVNSVNSGSPVVAQHTVKMPFTESMSGTIERPVSPVSSGYSSGIPESINEIWDPMEVKKPWGANRAPSSAYAPSAYRTAGDPAGSTTQQPSHGDCKQPQFAMSSTSDMSWLNLGDQSRV